MQRVREEEEAREGEGAISQGKGCLDVKDVFLQVPEEKPLTVILRSNTYVMSSLEEVPRYLKKTMDYCLVVEFPQAGEGYVKKSIHYWCLETFSDSDWSGNKSHRKSTPGGLHALNSCPLFSSSRTQKIISLTSCEAELRAIISSASDGIYIRSVVEFALGTKVDHCITDFSSAQNRKGFNMVQAPTDSNMADINTKPLGGQRVRPLMNLIG